MQGFIYKSWYSALSDAKTPKHNLMHFQYICTKYKEAEYNPGCGFSLWGQFPFMKASANIDDWNFACSTIKEVSKHRTIYRAVLSLDGETADVKDMNTRKKWQQFTEKRIQAIAKEYGIKPDYFCYAAAFHFKAGHPHTHLMFWDNSDDIRQEFIPKERFEVLSDKIREAFNKELFADELRLIYNAQDDIKKDFKNSLKNALSLLDDISSAMTEDADFSQTFGDTGCTVEADNSLYTAMLNEDTMQLLYNKIYFVAQALPKTGSLDYKYLPKEVKAVLDDLTSQLINAVPSFAEKHKALLKQVQSACRLNGNSEAGTMHNIKAVETQILKDAGNICLKWLKNNHIQIDYVKEAIALANSNNAAREAIRAEAAEQLRQADNMSIKDFTSGKPLPAEPREILGEENTSSQLKATELPSFVKLLDLFPKHYMKRSVYTKDAEFAKALKTAVLDIMKTDNVQHILNERLLMLRADALHTAAAKMREDISDIDFDASNNAVHEALKNETKAHFADINAKRTASGLKELREDQYWKEKASIYSLVRDEILKECERQNEWSEQWQRERAERERSWQQNREREIQINLSVHLVMNISRLFKSGHWRNYKQSFIPTKDKSAGQKRDLRKIMLQRSTLHWDNEYER